MVDSNKQRQTQKANSVQQGYHKTEKTENFHFVSGTVNYLKTTGMRQWQKSKQVLFKMTFPPLICWLFSCLTSFLIGLVAQWIYLMTRKNRFPHRK